MTRSKSQSDTHGAPQKRDGQLSTSVEQQINENLKRLYQQAAEEPLPDRLLQLLDELKQQDSTK
jgi:hypothetical protein